MFYVFYEQYLGMQRETALQLGVCLTAITVITLLLLGLNFAATFSVLLGVACIDISLLGLMSVWDINLNAISLVNLVVVSSRSTRSMLFCVRIVIDSSLILVYRYCGGILLAYCPGLHH